MESTNTTIFLPESPQTNEVSETANDLLVALSPTYHTDTILTNNIENNRCFVIPPVTYLQCTECGKYFKHRSVLFKHILNHRVENGEKPFTCTERDLSTANQSSLENRVIKLSDETTFECEECGYKTSKKYNLEKHKKKHMGENGEKPFACMECDFSTAWKRSLKTHLLIHSEEKPFECDECDYKASNKFYLEKHLKRNHLNRNHLIRHSETFSCDVCDFTTKLIREKKKHLTVHEGITGFTTKLIREKKKHLTVHERITGKLGTFTSYRDSEGGDILSKQTASIGPSSDIYNLENPCVCTGAGCAMSFASPSELNLHMSDIHYHAIEENHGTSHMLKQIPIDTEVKVYYDCSECDYKTTLPSALGAHLENIHLKELKILFACVLCSFRAAAKSTLNQHMKSHWGK